LWFFPSFQIDSESATFIETESTAMHKRIDLDGTQLHILDAGTGPPLLLIHGFPLDHQMWQPQIEEFQTTHRVIAPDLRGFGGSDVTEGTVTMEQFADDLAALLDRLEVTEPVTLCGLSMGGYVAWQFFQRHRSRLARLILCDTKATADTPEARRTREETAARVLEEGPEFLAENMPSKLFAQATIHERPEIVRDVQSVIRRTHPQGIAAASLGMAARPDVTGLLGRIDVPTLVIVGVEDQISTVEEMRSIADATPSARFREIPRSGHMAPLENPVEVNAAIREFVSP
jgi:3-oxoadipate enol-lactonase